MPSLKDNYKTLQLLLQSLDEEVQMDDFNRDLEGWLDGAIASLISIYGKDSMPVNYFRQINDEHLASTDDDGLIPKAEQDRTIEAARFHLEEFIRTFWDADVRTDFVQREHHKSSLTQDIAALESQHMALNTLTLSSWLITSRELMASRFGTHSSKYLDFAELKNAFENESARSGSDKETIKHDYYLRGRQKILAIINQLKADLEQMNITPPVPTTEKKTLLHSFKKITTTAWSIFITLFLAAVGGAYVLGKDNGATRYDQDKIKLDRENEALKVQQQNDAKRILLLADSITIYKNEIISLKKNVADRD